MNLTTDHIKRIVPFEAPFYVESALFNIAGKYSADYNGGQWTAAEHNGQLHFVAPEGRYNVVNADNYYDGVMDHVQYGRALTVMLYNRLLWNIANKGADMVNAASDQYYELYAALSTDREISRFLD